MKSVVSCPAVALLVSLVLSPLCLAQTPLYVWTNDPNAPGGAFGWSVGHAGDVDGDGFDDVIATNPGFNQQFQGHARVFSGRDGTELYRFDALVTVTACGTGDVNADGFDDIAVASTYSNGLVRVYSGRDGSVLLSLARGGRFDLFGVSVSGAGDVNADGHADVIVGAPGVFSDPGKALVFSGADGQVLIELPGDPQRIHLGTSVAGLGDVDLDGHDDVAVGSTGASAGGYARVFSGATGAPLYTVGVDGESAVVSRVGDIDGDARAEFAIGMPNAMIDGNEVGKVRVYSGSDGSIVHDFDGTVTEGFFGIAVSSAGDVNGDGVGDLIIGALGETDCGINTGAAYLLSGSGGALLYRFAGTEENAWVGASVGGGGDVNGDGFADVIVGAPGGDGTVTAFSGDDFYFNSTPRKLSEGQTVTLSTGQGVEGRFVSVYVTSLDDAPFLSPLFRVPLDGNGTSTQSLVVPTGISGLAVGLTAFTLGADGRAVSSTEERIRFE